MTPNKDKRIAIIYYNYPPGKEMIGASYLNVLPKSLWQILRRLEKDGYDASGCRRAKTGSLPQYATRAAISAFGIPAVWNNWSATGSRKEQSPCCQQKLTGTGSIGCRRNSPFDDREVGRTRKIHHHGLA